MAAAEIPNLDDELLEGLAPDGAPSDEDLASWDHDLDGETAPAAERVLGFRITDAGGADWVARKANRAADAIADLQAQRDRLLHRADAWLARERRRHDNTVSWAENLLEMWLLDEIAADTAKKPRVSRELPCGVKVKRTGGAPSLEVTDEDALCDWLQDHHPDLVGSAVVWKWSKADVKKLRDDADRIAAVDPETSEIVEAAGARIVRGPYSVTVEYGGGS